jgi:GNAT superfamily N-acetyltransferase
VQPHSAADTAELVEMYLGLAPADRTMGLPPATESRLRSWLVRFIEDGWSLVAEMESSIVGHTGVTPADASEPHLVVFVANDARSRGIGSELLRHLIAYAADSGHDAPTLTVAADNDAAVTVYDNLGFDVVEQMRGSSKCASRWRSRLRSESSVHQRSERIENTWLIPTVRSRTVR